MRIFISGIGGTAMAPLTEIATDANIDVCGSDPKHSPQTDELERRGVKVYYEQSEENIAQVFAKTPFDWLVYSSAIPEDSPELKFARDHHIHYSKRDEFLAKFIDDKHLDLIAIAGTHGKTTTTSMLVWVFHELHRPVSYSIGSTISFGPAGHFAKDARFFVYEADEYDRNFLAYQPVISTVVSLDYDHADIYPTIENYRDAFREFISNSQKTILWRSTANQLFPNGDQDNSLTILDDNISRKLVDLPGQKVRENAELVVEILRESLDGFDEDQIREILSRFPGADRRFEKIRENLISDYAHTPTEIKATLQKAREIADLRNQKIIAIYQPHQNARQIEILRENGYGDTFEDADEIYWLPTYLNRLDLLPGAAKVVTPGELVQSLGRDSQPVAHVVEFGNDLAQLIRGKLRDPNNLIVALGAGPIDGWVRENI